MRRLWSVGKLGAALLLLLLGTTRLAQADTISADARVAQIFVNFGGLDFQQQPNNVVGLTVDLTFSGLDPGEAIAVEATRVLGGVLEDVGPLLEIQGGVFVRSDLVANTFYTQSPPRLYMTNTAALDAYNAADGFTLFFVMLGHAGATAEITSAIVSGHTSNGDPIAIQAVNTVPEPASLTLLGVGLAAAATYRRRTPRNQIAD
jgi:hypothetical protein